MVSPPRRADWITPTWARKVVIEIAGCDDVAALEFLEAAVRGGQVRTRKTTETSEMELHREFWDGRPQVKLDPYPGEQLEFHQGDMIRSLQPAENKPTARRGRPPEYDWESMWVDALVRADLDGLPEIQAEFEEQVAEWFEVEQRKSPSVSLIREKASKVYRRKAGK